MLFGNDSAPSKDPPAAPVLPVPPAPSKDLVPIWDAQTSSWVMVQPPPAPISGSGKAPAPPVMRLGEDGVVSAIPPWMPAGWAPVVPSDQGDMEDTNPYRRWGFTPPPEDAVRGLLRLSSPTSFRCFAELAKAYGPTALGDDDSASPGVDTSGATAPAAVYTPVSSARDTGEPAIDVMDRAFAREASMDGITAAGAAWIKSVTDPFHDATQEPAPPPSIVGSSGVVFQTRSALTVTRPKNLQPGDKWDCNICMTPLMESTLINDTTLTYSLGPVPVLSSSASSSYRAGTVTVATAPTGAATWPSPTTGAGVITGGINEYYGISATNIDPTTGRGAGADATLVDGASLLLGAAFEVAHTGNITNKSGSVAYYEQPSSCTTDAVLVNTTNPQIGNVTAQSTWFTLPPSTVDEAVRLAGSRQRTAEEGGYTVGFLNDPNSAPMPPQARIIHGLAGDISPGYYTVSDSRSGARFGPSAVYEASFLRDTGISIRGQYYAGLDYNAVLTVTVIINTLVLPTPYGIAARLARPLPIYDPLALVLYTEIRRNSPHGVRVSENFTRGWFGDVLRTVGSVAKRAAPAALGAIGGALGGPAGAALGGTVGRAIQAIPGKRTRRGKGDRARQIREAEAAMQADAAIARRAAGASRTRRRARR